MDWRIKALTQFILAHLPYGEHLNHLGQLARGSFSDESNLAGLVMQLRYVRRLNDRAPIASTTILEIGPGWAGIGLLVHHLFGAGRIYAVDHRPHLRLELIRATASVALRNIDKVRAESRLACPERQLERICAANTLDECLDRMRVLYTAPGTSKFLPEQSVDLVYSYGVLEHIPVEDLRALMRETHRILKPTGRASHNVGLHDHFHSAGLGNGVNFLKYSDRAWNFFCANALLYHNRLRLPQYLELFAEGGFAVAWMDTLMLESDLEALSRIRIHPKFAGMTAHELATGHLFVDLRRDGSRGTQFVDERSAVSNLPETRGRAASPHRYRRPPEEPRPPQRS